MTCNIIDNSKDSITIPTTRGSRNIDFSFEIRCKIFGRPIFISSRGNDTSKLGKQATCSLLINALPRYENV